MSNFKSRLITEKDELLEKTNKLYEFINSDKFKSVDEYHKSLLKAQEGIMRGYICILTTRLDLL